MAVRISIKPCTGGGELITYPDKSARIGPDTSHHFTQGSIVLAGNYCTSHMKVLPLLQGIMYTLIHLSNPSFTLSVILHRHKWIKHRLCKVEKIFIQFSSHLTVYTFPLFTLILCTLLLGYILRWDELII